MTEDWDTVDKQQAAGNFFHFVKRLLWAVLRPQYGVWFSTVFLGLVIFLAFAGDWLAPHDPYDMTFMPLEAPSLKHPAGTDDLGRDVFSRVISGARISVSVGFFSIIIAAFIGMVCGLLAAQFRFLEGLLMRIIDALWSIPTILLAMAIAAAMTPGLKTVTVVIGFVYSPLFARLVYGEAVSVRERDYITAARSVGCSLPRIMMRHMLPNLAAPIIVQATLVAGTAIVLESSLSFLGVGILPPTPSWGVLIREGYSWLEEAYWLSIAPGVAIYFTVVSLNLLGDKLRVSMDPRQREKRV